MNKWISTRKLNAAFIRVYREDARIEQNGVCAYCHEPISAVTATADHVVPRKRHGNNGRGNIVAACEPCNQAKGHMSAEKFKRLLQSFPAGGPVVIIMAWSRRRINLAVERLDRNIGRAMGRSA